MANTEFPPPPDDRSGDDQRSVAAFLADPASHGGVAVERVDTHGALVFLAGDRAYKMKRAVRFPYMDFSTLPRRQAACAAEVRLNRRTAPDLYLGVETVVRRPDGRLTLGGPGTPVEELVVMRRFIEAQRFDRLAERGALTPERMAGLADQVAAFHDSAEPCPGAGGAAAMRWVVAENIAELRQAPDLFAPETVAALAARSAAALDRLAPLLDRRRDEGRVRRCHGDLHLRNIVMMDDRPVVFDAIEFNDDLAVIDVFYDLAFLLMDLEHRGLRPLANRVLNRYLERTGDVEGLGPLPLFLSARAVVRAKVGASAAAVGQADLEAARALRTEATAYLDHALAFLSPAPARLVAVGGLSGSGKSTLARALAPMLDPAPGAVVLRSDVARKRRMGVDEHVRLSEKGYHADITAAVYEDIVRSAGLALRSGHAVVTDAVYARPSERQAIEAVAAASAVPFTGFWLHADEPALVARVGARTHDASDATPEIVHRQLGYALGEITWQPIDASGDPAAVLAAVRAYLTYLK